LGQFPRELHVLRLRLGCGKLRTCWRIQLVHPGLRNARAKGKKLGRPKTTVDAARIVGLRAQGLPWRAIASQLGVGLGKEILERNERVA